MNKLNISHICTTLRNREYTLINLQCLLYPLDITLSKCYHIDEIVELSRYLAMLTRGPDLLNCCSTQGLGLIYRNDWNSWYTHPDCPIYSLCFIKFCILMYAYTLGKGCSIAKFSNNQNSAY